MRALVTGATGFVAGHLVADLLRNGHDVAVLVRPESDRYRVDALGGRCTVHVYDGSTAGLVELVRRADPEVIFHLASLVLSEHRVEDVEPLLRSNVLFGAQLLEAAVGHGVGRLVNTGSFFQHYGGADYSPTSLYAATKQAFASVLAYYVEVRGLAALTLTLYDTYGPDDPRKKLLSLLKAAAGAEEPLRMSPGEQRMALVHIDDVVAAFLHAARLLESAPEEASGAEYSVGPDTLPTLREVAAVYAEATGMAPNIAWGGRPYRTREVMEPWPGRRLPGWSPTIDLLDGIRRTEGIR